MYRGRWITTIPSCRCWWHRLAHQVGGGTALACLAGFCCFYLTPGGPVKRLVLAVVGMVAVWATLAVAYLRAEDKAHRDWAKQQ